MKSEIKGQEKEYPKLMVISENRKNRGCVVLFTDRERGTVVHAAGPHYLGERMTSWAMSHFEDFTGTVELSND